MPTLRVHSTVVGGKDRPPLILVHGAANSARVWTFWQSELASRGWSSHALDLRGHGGSDAVDLSGTRMTHYAADVLTLAEQLQRPPVLVGWSMGGLVAMMAAAACGATACVGVGPSAPARLQNASVPIRTGVFGAEEYGIVDHDPDRQPTMPDLDREERLIALGSLCVDSRPARDERKAGVVVRLDCPLLIVASTADSHFLPERYHDLPLEKDQIVVERASHWGLVLNRRVLPRLVSAVADWIQEVTRNDQV